MNNPNEFAGILEQVDPQEEINALKVALHEKELMIKSLTAASDQIGQDSFDLTKWAAEETKNLAARDKEFFYMGIGLLYSRMKEDRNTIIREMTVARAKEIDALQRQDNRYKAALMEISNASQHLQSNPNCAYILKLADEALKPSI